MDKREPCDLNAEILGVTSRFFKNIGLAECGVVSNLIIINFGPAFMSCILFFFPIPTITLFEKKKKKNCRMTSCHGFN
jgi:hypothetical protein